MNAGFNWIIYLFVILFFDLKVESKKRWKRQTLPSDNVQVHSFDSNVTITNRVEVNSSQSRIELIEKNFGSAIWSDSSFLIFNPNDEYVNLTAKNVISRFNLKAAQFYLNAQSFQLNESTNRKTDEETQLLINLENSVNLSLSDITTTTQVEAINGRRANITANTWAMQIARKLTLSSSITEGTNRKLIITSVSIDYNIVINLDGAQVGLMYGKVRLDITADYRTLVLLTDRHRVELRTVYSPFDLTLTDNELLVRAPDDNTILRIRPNSSNVDINVGQLSQMTMDRFKSSEVIVQKQSVVSGTEELRLDSKELILNLIDGVKPEDTSIHSSSNFSQLSMRTNLTKASLVAQHHFIQILGGTPHLLLLTGNLSLDITGNSNPLSAVTLLPPFFEPADQFVNIGPFGNGTNYPGIVNGTTLSNSTQRPHFLSTQKPDQSPNKNDFTINPNRTENSFSTPPGSTVNSTPINPNPFSTQFIGPITPPTSIQNSTENNQRQNNPENVATNFPQPETPFPPNRSSDNFIIGQFGTESSTSPKIEDFPISATISNVDLIDKNIPDDFPIPPRTLVPGDTTATFLLSTSQPLRMRHALIPEKRQLMEMKLRVERNSKIDNDSLIPELEEKFKVLVANKLSKHEKGRQKRMLPEFDVKIEDIEQIEPEIVTIKLAVNTSDNLPDLSFMSSDFNILGEEILKQNLKKKTSSSIQKNDFHMKLSALVILLILLLISVFIIWRCVSKRKKPSKYLKHSKIENISSRITV